MEARAKNKNNTVLDPSTTWGAPFAVAPWCQKKDPMPAPDEYPGYDTSQEGSHSVVFHQLYGGQAAWKDDCYMMLTETIGDVNEKYWSFSDFNHTFANCPGAEKSECLRCNIKMYGMDMELRTMLQVFIEARHGGKIPNPYFDGHGKGSTIWQEYTGINNFWGYNDKAEWFTEPQV
ncbi:hypothetical protein FFLO_01050 [Filobasidium floriforme]|uniref:Uncharacterized protein n=1 Tax=Filobasidium floriforme TaxID=5210 RepID=A0A8K0NSZ4_9TREE|nr:hypothetical protein FFLO_01050 [Filobasidium floriforme]